MTQPWYRWEGDDLLLSVRLQPKASRDELVGPYQQQFKIRITAPPVDGKANAHLAAYLAKCFGVSKGAVELVSGDTSRSKWLRIQQPRRLPDELQIEEK